MDLCFWAAAAVLGCMLALAGDIWWDRPYAGHRPIPAGSNANILAAATIPSDNCASLCADLEATAAHSAGTAGHVASLDCLRGLTSSCSKSLQTSPCHFMCDRLLQQGSLRVKFHRIPHHVVAVLLDIVLLDISSSQSPAASSKHCQFETCLRRDCRMPSRREYDQSSSE